MRGRSAIDCVSRDTRADRADDDSDSSTLSSYLLIYPRSDVISVVTGCSPADRCPCISPYKFWAIVCYSYFHSCILPYFLGIPIFPFLFLSLPQKTLFLSSKSHFNIVHYLSPLPLDLYSLASLARLHLRIGIPRILAHSSNSSTRQKR